MLVPRNRVANPSYRLPKNLARRPFHTMKTADESCLLSAMYRNEWISPRADKGVIQRLGIKALGGGPHQSKTMMLGDLTILSADGSWDSSSDRILRDNTLGKPSMRAREVGLYQLRRLYGLDVAPPICRVLNALWAKDPASRPMLAMLCALARDPSLRESADVVLDASLGEQVRSPALASVFQTRNPGRLNEQMSLSLARNSASSWTQAGFLAGAKRKERVRATATPVAAAYAALLGDCCGFGGQRLIESRWMAVIDRPLEERLALLRQAAGMGLVRVRQAGDVLEVEARRTMADALGVPDLVHG